MAVFTDDARWRKPVPADFEVRLPTRTVLQFWYELVKLKHFDYRQFLDSHNPLAYALMAEMDYNRKERATCHAATGPLMLLII